MLDVIYCPTHPNLIETMLDMADLGPSDVLIDLGSGDGRIVIAAAKRGIKKAIGIELDGNLIQKAAAEVIRQGLYAKCEFRFEDFYEADLSEATVITCFLDRLPHKKLLRKFANLKEGVKIVSNTFILWENDDEREAETDDLFKVARLWRVP